jgi:hypothetical protein
LSTYADYRKNPDAPNAITTLRMRDARNRMIEQLALALPYPLRNLPLPVHLIVASGQAAAIILGFSQQGVRYELWEADAPVSSPGAASQGTGGELILTTAAIDHDVTFRVHASYATDSARWVWLDGSVRVEEGIDKKLVAELEGLPLLDARIVEPKPSDARLAPWGAKPVVRIRNSQAGVFYELVLHTAAITPAGPHQVLSASGQWGNTLDLLLTVDAPLQDDLDVRVRGTRSVANSNETRVDLLDVVLPVRVLANTTVATELSPPTIAFGASTTVRVSEPQTNVRYRFWWRPLSDDAAVFGEAADATTLVDARVTGNLVTIAAPEQPTTTESRAGLTLGGPLHAANNGVEATLAPASHVQHVALFIEAVKQHWTGPLQTGELLPSAVDVQPALGLVIQPNPSPALELWVHFESDAPAPSLQVIGGQPGVFYTFFVQDASEPLELPIYVHQRDLIDPQFNYGIGRLRIDTDFALAQQQAEGDFSRIPPDPPTFDVSGLAVGTTLRVRAHWAATRLETELIRPITLPAARAIEFHPSEIPSGTSTGIVVLGTQSSEYYWLDPGVGESHSEASGTNAELMLVTRPLNETTEFRVAMSDHPATEPRFVRWVRAIVKVV